MIELIAESANDGTYDKFKFEGSVVDGVITYFDQREIVVKYDATSCIVEGGIQLRLDELVESHITYEAGTITLGAKLNEIEITRNSLCVSYELFQGENMIDERKVTYRWNNEK